MLRLAALLAATSALTPLMAAHAIKVTLSGEIDLGVNFPNVTSYSPTPEADAELNFDIVHDTGNGTELGGNLDLDASYTFAGTGTAAVSLSSADIYVSGDFGNVTMTTDGELDKAESYLSIADEVVGEEGDLSIIYSTPVVEGIQASVVFDILNGDAAGSLSFTNDLVDAAVDIEQVDEQFFVDGEVDVTYGEFTGSLYGAIGVDDNDVETEAAAKVAYDFGTAEVYGGITSYLELAGGVEFDVQGLTLTFDVSGMAKGVDPSTNSILTATSTVAETLKFGLDAEFEFADHLVVSAGVDTETVTGTNTTTASLGATLSF